MASFAKGTSVSVEKTQGEIQQLVTKHGATGFITGWQGDSAVIAFEMRDRRVKFVLNLTPISDKKITHTPGNQRRSALDQIKVKNQLHRELWRALLLVIKAKLEAVASGIRLFEQEFLNDIVTANGMTIGETIMPRLEGVVSTGQLPPLLPGPRD